MFIAKYVLVIFRRLVLVTRRWKKNRIIIMSIAITHDQTRSFKKILPIVLAAAAILAVAAFVSYQPVADASTTPAQWGLKEGDRISANNIAAGIDDPDLYIINDFGYMRLILNPAIAAMYGQLGAWPQPFLSRVKTVSPAVRDAFTYSGLFRNCESNEQAVWAYEFTGEDTGVIHHVAMTGEAAVAQDANFFKKVFCINNKEAAWFTKSPVDYTNLSQIMNYCRPGQSNCQGVTPTPPPSGPISATLAANNPASGTLVAGQAIADLIHIQFMGTGTVTQMVFKRIGISSDTTLSSVYLYEGESRLSDSSTVSSNMITFNDPTGLFVVNGSRVISTKSNIAASTSGQTVGLQLVSYTVTGGTMSTVNLNGNLFTIAEASLATADFGATTTPAAATINPQNDYVMWQNTVTVGVRSVTLKSFKLRQVGSVYPTDLSNFRLYVDGVQAGGAVASLDAQGYITFDLSGAPVTLQTGGRIIKLVGNIVNGSSRNFSFSLRQAGDINVVDSNFGVSILATNNGSAFSAVTSGVQTLGAGTISITKTSDSPSVSVVKGASGVTLARYTVQAAGEKVKVENLSFNIVDSANRNAFSLRNGAIFMKSSTDTTWTQIGSTQSICGFDDQTTGQCTSIAVASASYTTFTFGSALTVDPLNPVQIEVRADMVDNDGTDNVTSGDTVQARVFYKSTFNNAQLMTSLSYINAPTAANQDGNTLTIQAGTLTLSKYAAYADQTVIVPKSLVKLGHYTLTGSAFEDVNVNTIAGGFTEGDEWTAAKLADVYVKVVGPDGNTVYTSDKKGTVSATASSSWSVNFVIAKNVTQHVEVWGTVQSFTVAGADDTMRTEVSVTGTTTQSNTSTSTSVILGQTMTGGAGSVASGLYGTISDKLTAANTTTDAVRFSFTGTNDAFTLTDVTMKVNNANAASTVAKVLLKDVNGTTVAQKDIALVASGSYYATFTGLSLTIPANVTDGLVLTGAVQFGSIGVGAATTSANAQLTMTEFKAQDSNGTQTTGDTDRAGANLYAHASYPTVASLANVDGNTLNNGTKYISSFNLSNTGGQVGWDKIKWTTAKDTNTIMTSSSFKLFENGVDVSSQGTFTVTGAGAGFTAGTIIFVWTAERPLTTTTKYELQTNVSGVDAAGDFIQAQITQPSSNATPSQYATVAATTASFVWTDRSAASHGLGTGDWMNDHLVLSLPLTWTSTK